MIINIAGEPYSGKTLRNNHYCYMAHKAGLICLTNYESKYSEQLETMGQLEKIPVLEDNSRPTKYFVGLSDLTGWLDNRESMKHTLVTWLLNSYGHRGIVLVYDDQVVSSVDYRLTNITTMFEETKQIQFPLFQITQFNPNGVPLGKPFRIRYGKEIYNTYSSVKLVSKKIRYPELRKLYDIYEIMKSGDKLFAIEARTKWDLSLENGKILFLMLINDAPYDAIERIIKSLGYTLLK